MRQSEGTIHKIMLFIILMFKIAPLSLLTRNDNKSHHRRIIIQKLLTVAQPSVNMKSKPGV